MPVVQLYANLRSVAGLKETRVSGSTLREVLDELTRQIPPLQAALLKEGRIRPFVIITLNGQTVDLQDGIESPVAEDDRVAIFPPIAGG